MSARLPEYQQLDKANISAIQPPVVIWGISRLISLEHNGSGDVPSNKCSFMRRCKRRKLYR